MDDLGIGGMVGSAAWCDDRLGMEVLSIVRGALDPRDSCTMELAGRQFFVRVTLDGGWIWVHATSMDESDEPQISFQYRRGPDRLDDDTTLSSGAGAKRAQVAPLATDPTRRAGVAGLLRNRLKA